MNLYHRRFCSSPGGAKTLESTVIPWADYDLGQQVLEIGPGPGLATDVRSVARGCAHELP